MNDNVLTISLTGLALAFIPAVIVIAIMLRWRAGAGTAVYATLRMLVQLLLIGYVLIYIFETDNWLVISSVLAVMLLASSWIAVRPIPSWGRRDYVEALVAITAGGVPTLFLVTQFVLGVEPWFSPRYVVPLAGMIFAGSMTAVSLAAERFLAESGRDIDYHDARRTAFNAALIPIVNSLFSRGTGGASGDDDRADSIRRVAADRRQVPDRSHDDVIRRNGNHRSLLPPIQKAAFAIDP